MWTTCIEGPEFRAEGEPLLPEQLALRKAVLAQVTDHPETFGMGSWESTDSCGTTRCIAGWAQFLARGFVVDDGEEEVEPVYVDAVRLLGLTWAEFHLPTGLFYTGERDAVERLRALCESAEQ